MVFSCQSSQPWQAELRDRGVDAFAALLGVSLASGSESGVILGPSGVFLVLL